MFDHLFRRDAAASALCVNLPDDGTEPLHDAERRIAQLEMLRQEKVIELDQFRAIKSSIADSLDVVIHLERRPGRRLVTEVIEIKGYDPDTDRFDCRRDSEGRS